MSNRILGNDDGWLDLKQENKRGRERGQRERKRVERERVERKREGRERETKKRNRTERGRGRGRRRGKDAKRSDVTATRWTSHPSGHQMISSCVCARSNSCGQTVMSSRPVWLALATCTTHTLTHTHTHTHSRWEVTLGLGLIHADQIRPHPALPQTVTAEEGGHSIRAPTATWTGVCVCVCVLARPC